MIEIEITHRETRLEVTLHEGPKRIGFTIGKDTAVNDPKATEVVVRQALKDLYDTAPLNTTANLMNTLAEAARRP